MLRGLLSSYSVTPSCFPEAKSIDKGQSRLRSGNRDDWRIMHLVRRIAKPYRTERRRRRGIESIRSGSYYLLLLFTVGFRRHRANRVFTRQKISQRLYIKVYTYNIEKFLTQSILFLPSSYTPKKGIQKSIQKT